MVDDYSPTIEDRVLSANKLPSTGVEADLDYERAKRIEPEGDFEVHLDYNGETVARALGTETYMDETELILNGKAPWLTGEDAEDFTVDTESGEHYALVSTNGGLEVHSDMTIPPNPGPGSGEPQVQRLGQAPEQEGVVAYFWEDETEHAEERGPLTMIPGEDTTVASREHVH